MLLTLQAAAQPSDSKESPEEARKVAEEVEERRLAEIRSHGMPVTPETFAAWKARRPLLPCTPADAHHCSPHADPPPRLRGSAWLSDANR